MTINFGTKIAINAFLRDCKRFSASTNNLLNTHNHLLTLYNTITNNSVVLPRPNARVVHVRVGWLCVKRPVNRRQTSSYLTTNAQIVLQTLQIRVVPVTIHLLWVKRPAINRQTSSYLAPNVQVVWSTANARVVQVRKGW